MKKYLFAAAFALALCAPCARAAVFHQSDGARVGPEAEEKASGNSTADASKKDEKKPSSTRDAKSPQPNTRSGEAASAVTPQPATAAPSTSDAPTKPGTNAPVPVSTPAKTTPASDKTASDKTANDNKPSGTNGDASRRAEPSAPSASGTSNTSGTTPLTNAPNVAASASAPLTSIYRIGVGDVLDIRTLNDQSPRQSTLYTIGAGGVLDHPLLRDPLTVAGMTTDELAAQLVAEFRHRGIYEKPQVRVSVREYASHVVLVSGLVNDPGPKIIQREAIPLYVLIAGAQSKSEAGRAVIISHSTGKVTTVDLNDAVALNTLVQAGDVVNLTVRPPEYFYIGGEISSPGQKDFHSGMTLTQAVLASGGVTATAGEKVKVARAGADGRLVSAEYNLNEIEGGVVPDPVLQAGDRIEVSRAAKVRK